MTRVYVSIGSNIDKEKNIVSCLATLRERFGALQMSRIYENRAMGFDGDNFLNLVVGLDTTQDVYEVAREMREIEYAHGRVRGGERFSSRSLDIDLLLYDELVTEEEELQLPRNEIVKYAFVLKPLAEIDAARMHPVLKRSMGDLWSEYQRQHEPAEMWPVELEMRGVVG
jgi:2-amino-4-hydroxy-6-hydroxymethyldihydropteridine diphosphokinase